MKEKLDSESRAAIVNYRLERAYETLKEADYNTAGGYYNAAVNRLYYAWHYKIFCVNGKYGIQVEFRIFYFIALQNEEDYERKESSSA